MKNNIAILILAHHNQEQLTLLINHLSIDFDVYVQIDRKSDLVVAELPQTENVFYYKELQVFWGDFSQVENMRFILEKAHLKGYDFYSFISGDDLPIKSNQEIKNFIDLNKDKNYMYANPLPIATWGFNKGFDRLDRFWFMKMGNRKIVKILGRATLLLQKMLFFKIKRFDINYYAGSNWVNLNGKSVSYIFSFLNENPNYLKKLKYSRATDEIWIQSIIMNSPFKKNVENYDLRHINWTKGPEYPRVLNKEDILDLKNSKGLFARKFSIQRNELFIENWLKELK